MTAFDDKVTRTIEQLRGGDLEAMARALKSSVGSKAASRR